MHDKNKSYVKRLSEAFGVSEEAVIDNMITAFQARRMAEDLEGIPGAEHLLEFAKDGESLVTGEDLFEMLIVNYRWRILQAAGK